MNLKAVITAACIAILCIQAQGQGSWTTLSTTNSPSNRHECTFVASGDKYYLIGGRGIKPVNVFDPNSSTWTSNNNTPFEMHHFQAVDYFGLIYIMGTMTGGFPSESPVAAVQIYDPYEDRWHVGENIPANRRRGSAGVIVRGDKIYMVAGITNGHLSGWVNWFDEFDPKTNSWTTLPNAPTSRDHFHAAFLNDKIVLAGGRRSGQGGSTFNSTVGQVDIFDFNAGSWSTLPSGQNIPTERAGCMAGVIGNEAIIIGGESGSQSAAHLEVEALNVNTNTWRSLDDLNEDRHGTQAIIDNNSIYVSCGSGNRGGTPELNSTERFAFGTPGSSLGSALVPGTPDALPGLTFGTQSDTIGVYIRNIAGNQALLVDQIDFVSNNAFSDISFTNDAFAIPPGDSVKIDVVFSPSNGNYVSDSMIVRLIAPYGGRLAIFLEGNSNIPPPPPSISLQGNDHKLCNGDSVNLSLSGTFNSYLWSNGASTATISAEIAGMYFATVTAGTFTLYSDTISITVDNPSLNYSPTYVSCDNGNDGAINLFVNDGYPSYSYLWSNGFTTEDLSNLTSGLYVATVTDSEGCSASINAYILEPAVSTQTEAIFTPMQNGFLFNFNNQSINANSYLWNFGDGSPLLTDSTPSHTYLNSGAFNVTLTTQNQCGQDDTTITVLIRPSISLQGNNNKLCQGETVDLQLNGNFNSYAWSNGSSSSSINVNSAGQYFVIVNSNGTLLNSDTINIIVDGLNLNYSPTYVSCDNGNDGAINLFVNDGYPSYSYLWSNGFTTEDLSNLTSGLYVATVTDSEGCSASINAYILEPAVSTQTEAIFTPTQNGFLFNFNNQSVNADSYLWNFGDGSPLLTDSTPSHTYLNSGAFNVTLTTQNQCGQDDTTITVFIRPSIGLQGNNNKLCQGETVDLQLDGTFSSYLWSNGSSSSSVNINSAGQYFVAVNANGTILYSDTMTIQVSNPVTVLVSTNVSCTQGTDGSINQQVSLGYPPYSYLWTGGSTNQNLMNLSAGTYTVSVTDMEGCTDEQSVAITEPLISTNVQASFSFLPNGLTVSFSDLSINGDSLIWNFGDNSATVNDTNPVHTYAAPGMYNVILNAQNNCDADDTTITVMLITTGINSAEGSPDFFIDQLNHQLVISSLTSSTESYRYNLYDVLGRFQLQSNQAFNLAEAPVRIDLNLLSTGSYFVRIYSNQTSHTFKFIIADK